MRKRNFFTEKLDKVIIIPNVALYTLYVGSHDPNPGSGGILHYGSISLSGNESEDDIALAIRADCILNAPGYSASTLSIPDELKVGEMLFLYIPDLFKFVGDEEDWEEYERLTLLTQEELEEEYNNNNPYLERWDIHDFYPDIIFPKNFHWTEYKNSQIYVRYTDLADDLNKLIERGYKNIIEDFFYELIAKKWEFGKKPRFDDIVRYRQNIKFRGLEPPYYDHPKIDYIKELMHY